MQHWLDRHFGTALAAHIILSLAFYVALICLGFAWVAPASAYTADPVDGARLARRHCSICHGIGAAVRSPDNTAPPFSLIARSGKFRARGAAFVLEPHRRMPLFGLTGEQAEDLTAYIRTLTRR